MDWYIGTIGYSYRDWRTAFYPADLPDRNYLAYYSRVFNTVEVDTTFYGIPRIKTLQSWAANVPPEFRFCLKTPRIITHDMKLTNANALMAEFVEVVRNLGENLGVILIQLPPSYHIDQKVNLDGFLSSLPPGVNYAIELRSPGWYHDVDQTAKFLHNHGVCWVGIDFPGIPTSIVSTAEFLYIRWIGKHGAYHPHTFEREQREDELQNWLARLVEFTQRKQAIYGFFNNDYCGYAAGTAIRFYQMLGQPGKTIDPDRQMRLF